MATYSSGFVGPIPNQSNVPGLYSTTPLPNFTVSQAPAVNVNQAIKSGGVTPSGSVAGASTTQIGPTYSGPVNNSPSSAGTQGVSTPTDGGQPDISAELDSIFNPVFSALQGQEDTLRQNYSTVEPQITAQSDLSKQSLLDQKTSGMRELTGQETAAGTRKEDALNSAARLYNELQRGGQQRFGGSSSAGEAFGTLTAQEQQRREGTIQSAYETAMQQVGTFKANLEDKYSTAVKEVNLQVQADLAEAQRQFRDSLQSISSAKAQAQSDKAAASLNALQDLRNKAYTINMQALQFTQQLALNKEATLKQVEEYTQKALQSVSGGQSAVASSPLTGYSPSTTLGVSPTKQATSALAQTGQVTTQKKYDQFGNLIA